MTVQSKADQLRHIQALQQQLRHKMDQKMERKQKKHEVKRQLAEQLQKELEVSARILRIVCMDSVVWSALKFESAQNCRCYLRPSVLLSIGTTALQNETCD